MVKFSPASASDLLRARILILLGLVPAACRESTPAVVVVPPSDTVVATVATVPGSAPPPPPAAPPMNTSLVSVVVSSHAVGRGCGLDEVREHICGIAGTATCGPTGDALVAYGDSRTIEHPSYGQHDPALVSFFLDAPMTAAYAAKYRSRHANATGAPCCYSRCGHLAVSATPRLKVPPGMMVRDTCLLQPTLGTSVPAKDDPECPAGVMLNNDTPPFSHRGPDACCYATIIPIPTCGPQEEMGYDGECHRHNRGRPLLENGAVVLAPVVRKSDWADCGADFDGLDPELREAAARAWAREAAAEHASVAAFSRLSLELMSLGAPADLLDAVHRAAREEITHARTAYSIASALAGELLGPGPLRLVDIARPVDLVVFARATFLEGCVGEIVAALAAAELRSVAATEIIADALDVIARDEADHAALAFRIVAWAIAEGGAPVARAIEAIRLDTTAIEVSDLGPLARFGILGEAAAQSIRARAIRDVVVPCTKAMLHSVSV